MVPDSGGMLLLTVIVLGSCRLEIDVDAFDVALHLADEESLDRSLGQRALKIAETRSAPREARGKISKLLQTFILDSSLSCKMRLNSWTSCCRNESSDFHPNDFVNSLVAGRARRRELSYASEGDEAGASTDRRVDPRSGGCRRPAGVLALCFHSVCPLPSGSDRRPAVGEGVESMSGERRLVRGWRS